MVRGSSFLKVGFFIRLLDDRGLEMEEVVEVEDSRGILTFDFGRISGVVLRFKFGLLWGLLGVEVAVEGVDLDFPGTAGRIGLSTDLFVFATDFFT